LAAAESIGWVVRLVTVTPAAGPISAQAWRLTVPVVAAVLAMAARAYLLGQVNLTGLAFQIVQAVTLGAVVLAAALAVRSLITLLGELVIAAPGILEPAYDVHLLRLVTRVSGLAAAAAVIIYGANVLGVPLVGLVAGVGVGGLALALAAQSTVENLFGGVSIFADRPFRVGDFIIFPGGQGYVESIGPRSTRIRAEDGMQITVPNADLAKMQVINKTSRDATLFEHVVRFTHDATPDQLAEFARRTLAIFETYPLDAEAPVPPRVRIVGLGDFSIDVQVHAELVARHEDDFYRLQELLLLDVMRIAGECGLAFALPTRTLHVAPMPQASIRIGPG
jgi:MscS family membrane protein